MKLHKVDKFIYDMLTTQPMYWDEDEHKLVLEQIPDYDDHSSGQDIIKAQTIVSEHRKKVLEILL